MCNNGYQIGISGSCEAFITNSGNNGQYISSQQQNNTILQNQIINGQKDPNCQKLLPNNICTACVSRFYVG
jgi:hypothetical protein